MYNDLFRQYNAAIIKRKQAEAEEQELRLRIFAHLMKDGYAKSDGSKSSTIEGWRVKATGKVNTSIYEAGLQIVREGLTDEEFAAAFPAKLSYSATGAKKLTDDKRELVKEALVTKPGMPAIELEYIGDGD